MKTKVIALGLILFAAGSASGATPVPTVEFKGAFIKISASVGSVDTPAELNPPLLLYIRKVSILRVSMAYDARNTTYDVAIVTFGAEGTLRANVAPPPGLALAASAGNVDSVKTYTYRFSTETGAAAFCDDLLSNQDG